MRRVFLYAVLLWTITLPIVFADVADLRAPAKPEIPVTPIKIPDGIIRIADSWASFTPDKLEAAAWRGGCWGVMVTIAAYTALGMCGYLLVQNAKQKS